MTNKGIEKCLTNMSRGVELLREFRELNLRGYLTPSHYGFIHLNQHDLECSLKQFVKKYDCGDVLNKIQKTNQ